MSIIVLGECFGLEEIKGRVLKSDLRFGGKRGRLGGGGGRLVIN